MAILSYSVGFGASYATTLADVQSVSINLGRQWIVDGYSAGTAQITSRNISAWTTAPQVGDQIRISASGTIVFGGRITDVEIFYGNLTSMDYAVITCESFLSLMGRRNLVSLSLAQGLTSTQITTVINTAYSTMSTAIQAGSSTAVAQTYTGNALEALNTLAITEVGRFAETFISTTEGLRFMGRGDFNPTAPTIALSDADTSLIQYEQINFRSTTENYYTRVTINPLTVASQTNNNGSAPYFTLELSTYDYNTLQADSLSQYYLNQFSSKTATPTSFVSSYSQQTTAAAQTAFLNAIGFGSIIGAKASQVFRGTTYNTIIEGLTINADIGDGDTRVEWYCSAQDLNAYLILNDAIYGKLNQNRLGF